MLALSFLSPPASLPGTTKRDVGELQSTRRRYERTARGRCSRTRLQTCTAVAQTQQQRCWAHAQDQAESWPFTTEAPKSTPSPAKTSFRLRVRRRGCQHHGIKAAPSAGAGGVCASRQRGCIQSQGPRGTCLKCLCHAAPYLASSSHSRNFMACCEARELHRTSVASRGSAQSGGRQTQDAVFVLCRAAVGGG